MSRIDQYRPNHESHGSRFDDRQARSPRRSPSPYYYADTYTRPRSRSPGPRPMPPRDGRARGKGRRPTNPGGIFKGLKYHCVSSEDDSKQSRRLGFRMNNEGALGVEFMKDADIIIVFAPDPQKYKTVILDQTLPSCQPRGYPGTLNEVYQYFATRLHPGRDPRHRNRKCVMQADWAELCLRNNRLLPDMDKADWEIQVDNSASATQAQTPIVTEMQDMEDGRPLTPPIPHDPLIADSFSQEIPCFQYRATTSVRSVTRELPDELVRADQLEPQSTTSADHSIPLPDTIETRPPDTLLEYTAPPLSQTHQPSPLIAEPILSLQQSTTPPISTNLFKKAPDGVFARNQVAPGRFHVLDADKNAMSLMMIEQFGGGYIVPLNHAAIIVVPGSGIRVANTKELMDLMKSIEFGQEVVSVDYITQCIKEDRLVDKEPFRLILPIVEPSQGSENVKAEVEGSPAPLVQYTEPARRIHTLPTRAHVTSIRPCARQDTARPSGTRQDTATGLIIKIEDDDDSDDDCIMLEAPPPRFLSRATKAISKCERDQSEVRYPTPPETPNIGDNERGRSPEKRAKGVKMDLTHDELVSDDGDDHVPLQRPIKHFRHFPELPEMRQELITDPVEKEKEIQASVHETKQHPFRLLEEGFQEWAKRGFHGTFIEFYATMDIKHPRRSSGSWDSIFRNYRYIFYRMVDGLRYKGRPGARGPKDFNFAPEPESVPAA